MAHDMMLKHKETVHLLFNQLWNWVQHERSQICVAEGWYLLRILAMQKLITITLWGFGKEKNINHIFHYVYPRETWTELYGKSLWNHILWTYSKCCKAVLILLEFKRFWQWCIPLRITGFLDVVHCLELPVSKTLCFLVSRIPDDGRSPETQRFWILNLIFKLESF
jgi:hypothetical protein